MFKRLHERQSERSVSQTGNDTQEKKINLQNFISLESLKKLKIAYIPYNELFKEGIIAGVGWAIGVTIGFVIVSSILVVLLRQLGGLPLIGGWIASVVEETQGQLLRRTPIISQ